MAISTKDAPPKTFGGRVRWDRERLGLSRFDLATRLIAAGVKITPGGIELWEMGKSEPRLGRAQACARVLGWPNTLLLELLPKGR
jgi:transcriptional regulator with XRE-family HTH domain